MKKFAIAMAVIFLIGAVLSGIGCAVFFSSDFSAEKIEYFERFYETEETVTELDLRIENTHKVILQRGEKCSVKYFDSSLTEFSASAQGGKLIVAESRWSWKNWLKRIFCRLQTTDVIITVTEDVKLNINGTFSGATEIELPSWEYGNINLDLRGASNIVAEDITADNISLNVSGAANMELSGKANTLRTDASGAMNMVCEDLECPLIDLRVSGSSKVSVSGTGSVLSLHASGLGKLWAKDFTLDSAEIEASGSVTAEVNVKSLLKVHTSGSAYVAYWGNPQIERSSSGSSEIVQKG